MRERKRKEERCQHLRQEEESPSKGRTPVIQKSEQSDQIRDIYECQSSKLNPITDPSGAAACLLCALQKLSFLILRAFCGDGVLNLVHIVSILKLGGEAFHS